GASNAISLLLILITSFILLVQTGFSNDVTNPPIGSPAQTPLSPHQKYIKNCATKLDPNCYKEIFDTAFYANTTVSDTCCVNLESGLGQKCHEDITGIFLSTPKFKADSVLIWKRSKDVWNDCVSRLDTISPSKSPNPF
ncbi:hypothetical protein RYX36_018390, partial [Vicia faba]